FETPFSCDRLENTQLIQSKWQIRRHKALSRKLQETYNAAMNEWTWFRNVNSTYTFSSQG
ncbi:MAG: hypothetical protein AAFW75_11910, partial [Cyanobacteria bacterium J06636_16]